MQYQQHPTYGQYEAGVWKTIPGFSKYEVNNMSEIRNKKTKRVLKTNKEQRVDLSDENNKKHMVRVYSVSLMAFFPDIPRLKTVDHIDENHLNHNLSNLQWETRGDNSRKSNLLRPRTNRTKQSKAVLMYDSHGTFIREYKSANEAARELELKQGSISACCRGKRNTCGDDKYTFKFKEKYEDIPGEVWKPIVTTTIITEDKEGDSDSELKETSKQQRGVAYVSNYGRIKTKNGIITKGKIEPRRPQYRVYGGADVHTIVWDAFGNRSRYELSDDKKRLFVLHDDNVPLDEDGCRSNAIEHLRLGTASENMRESTAIGNKKKYCKRVQQLDDNGNIIAEYPSIANAARQTNCSFTTIWWHVNDKVKQTKKRWRLVESGVDECNESSSDDSTSQCNKKQKLDNVNIIC